MAESFALELPGGLGWVIEPPADPCGDGYVRTAVVGIWAGGLQARTVVTFSDGPWNPARFFAELAADWRGWDGERRWRSLEGEMEIEASHDGRGHVLIGVTVLYVALYVLALGASFWFVMPQIWKDQVGHPATLRDYFELAWLISSLAMIGGALGAALESDDAVREAAYVQHPDEEDEIENAA